MSVITDEELVREIQKGDILAFEDLVKRYQGRLLVFVRRIINEEHTAEDIVIDVLFKVYKTIDRVDTKRKFSTYIYQIAKNDAISYLRGKKYDISLEELEIIDEDETIYEKLERGDEKKQVTAAIRKLEKKYQEAIKLYYFDDLSYGQIANRLKLPINTVRTHLRRAKEALKRNINMPALSDRRVYPEERRERM